MTSLTHIETREILERVNGFYWDFRNQSSWYKRVGQYGVQICAGIVHNCACGFAVRPQSLFNIHDARFILLLSNHQCFFSRLIYLWLLADLNMAFSNANWCAGWKKRKEEKSRDPCQAQARYAHSIYSSLKACGMALELKKKLDYQAFNELHHT